jgi:hypothetical protein
MSIEAMKLALEALEFYHDQHGEEKDGQAINALRQAIEQAEQQEPVAWISHSDSLLSWDKFYDHMEPLYTAPPQRQPLTDEEISNLWDGHTVPVFGKTGINPIVFARAIEAKLREKNNAR